MSSQPSAILMTQAQYARHRNQSPQYISKLAKAGVLPVWPKQPSRRNGTLLYTVGVYSAKSTIYGRLKITDPSPGFCHFSAEHGTDYFEQLLSETLVTTYSRGTPIREWRNRAARSPRRPSGCPRSAKPAARAACAARRWTAACTLSRRCRRLRQWACRWTGNASGLR
jgi:hypothetical protein